MMEKQFLDLQIKIKGKVFQPRIETEYWVKKVIEKLKKKKIKGKKMVLDIFCGTGCIGISLLKNFRNFKVDFIDIDPFALKETRENLKKNKIPDFRFSLFLSDLFKNKKLKNKRYDFIFANPPYVAKEYLKEVQESVRLGENKISWYGGKEGLEIIKKFLKLAKNFLKKGGAVFMEIDPFQKEKIKKILAREGYKRISFLKDQFKKTRMVKFSL